MSVQGKSSMQGKTCVITGATSGIGRAAAEALAAMGACIVVVARDRARGSATLRRLGEIAPGVAHRAHYADLSLLAETKRVAAEIAAVEPTIDVLVNNAGALYSFRGVTKEGIERTFALNHLSYVAMTHGLRERLFAGAPARVVNTSSAMHKREVLDFDNLQMERGYNGVTAYERSKLANVLFTRELARRWAVNGVTANCLHPGLVASRFGNRSGGLVPLFFGLMKITIGLSAAKGARTIVYLASSLEVAGVTGGYFEKCRQYDPGRGAERDDDALRLWVESEKIAGLA